MNQAAFGHRTYSSEGFILARKKYGEADRILILFTKDQGKVSYMAKGVRKVTSRKRGGIEIFNHIKFSAVKGRNLDILTEVEVIDSYEAIRRDLKKVSLAYYFCEVSGRVTRDGEKHEELFEIMKNALEELKSGAGFKELRLNFVKNVLVSVGFWPGTAKMDNPDAVLENVIEREVASTRVGKRMLRQG